VQEHLAGQPDHTAQLTDFVSSIAGAHFEATKA
jgi:hypothetical protein